LAKLVLGPLLRYVGPTEATFWVETDAPCEVEALGATARTFCVGGHHYALVCQDGLEPGTTTPYEVRLDGERVWPLEDWRFPPSVVRTPSTGADLEIAFGSCRVSVPNVAPWTLDKDDDDRGRETDALRALALRMRERDSDKWPHALILLGDQVYADEVSPDALAFIRGRRDVTRPPGEQVADFEEYVALYHESWSDPAMRWLLSTVPSAMIFDDHDVHDDWNTSRDWVDDIRRQPWWNERIHGAFVSYWVYQHLGNLSPRELANDELFARVCEAQDGEEILREFSYRADRETDGARWSYCRDFGSVRLVMIDSRAGRKLEPGSRRMVDDAEWRWIEQEARGGCDHLLIGTSLPWLLARGLHEMEAWNEAVCDGAWGRRASKLGERIRQAVDLEHWAAFNHSFRALSELLASIARGERGEAPATIVALSGDVHHAYLAEADVPGARSRVFQAVCSPFRNPLDTHERRAVKLTESGFGRVVCTALARAAGVKRPPYTWKRLHDARWFDNQVATLCFSGRDAKLTLERTLPGPADPPQLELSYDWDLG